MHDDNFGQRVLEEAIGCVRDSDDRKGREILENVLGNDGFRILNSFFPKETKRLVDLIDDTVNMLASCKDSASTAFLVSLSNLAGLKAERQEETFDALFTRLSNTLQNYWRELHELLNNRAFELAIKVCDKVNDLKRNEKDEFNADRRLKIWGAVAENIYADKYGLSISKVFEYSNEIKSIGESLAEKSAELHDFAVRDRTSEISELLNTVISDVLGSDSSSSNLSSVVYYLTQHIHYSVKTLKSFERMELIEDITVTIEDFREYLDKLITDLGILEYEVYSLLIRNRIPAIPSIEAKVVTSEERKPEFFELDIIAMNSRKFINVEVTSRQNEENLIKKVKRLSDQFEALGIPSVIVTTRDSRDIVRRYVGDFASDEIIKCVSCDVPYKIIQAIKQL